MTQVAMLTHMQRFYDLLDSKAETDDNGGRIYSGHTTKDFYSLDLPQPYYSRMVRLLQQMGCMTQLERGSRDKLSKWILHARPTEELYAEIDPNETNIATIREQVSMYQSAVNQRIRLLRGEIANLHSRSSHLQVAVMNQATMIAKLYEHLNIPLPKANNDVPAVDFPQELDTDPDEIIIEVNQGAND